MKYYQIKNQHQQTGNHSKHSSLHCLLLHTKHKHTTIYDKTSVFLMGTHLKVHTYNDHTYITVSDQDISKKCKENLKTFTILLPHNISVPKKTELLTPQPLKIHLSEHALPCQMHTKLAQLRINKSSLL